MHHPPPSLQAGEVDAAGGLAAGAVADSGDPRPPVHGNLTRAGFEYAKQVERTGPREKDGALGDAVAGRTPALCPVIVSLKVGKRS